MKTEVTLCNIVVPQDSRKNPSGAAAGKIRPDPHTMCKETYEALYYRKKGGVRIQNGALVFQKGAEVSFGTYFNGFAADTWRRYARLGTVCLRLRVCGRFRLRLMRMHLRGAQVYQQVLLQTDVAAEENAKELLRHQGQVVRPQAGLLAGTYQYAFPKQAVKGEILYFELLALDAGGRMDGAEYVTRLPADLIQPVKLAVGICTYKREDYLTGNLRLMTEKLEQPGSMLSGHMEIFVADNGHTLGGVREQFPLVHIFENPNLGGAAGFTRCMMEAVTEAAGFTHLLLMDDDVQLEWSSIEKTYTLLRLLRPQYQDAFVAGAMLRADQPWIQEESGGVFGKYGNRPLQKGLDLRVERDCLKNSAGGPADYGAWWYCCFPAELVNQAGLPLPLFIHGDDVEWGLRCNQPVIRMNGICVWHEPLEGKACAHRVYYNLRNLLVCQALYGKRSAGVRMALLLWKQFFHDAFLYQYASCRAGLCGVEDFLKGPVFLAQADAQQLHQRLSAMRRPLRKVSSLRGEVPWDQVHAAASYRPGRLEQAVKALLLNGSFLPGGRDRFVPDGQFSFAAAWHSSRLVFVDEKQQGCYVLGFDRKQFLRLFCLTACTAVRLAAGFGRIAKAYRTQAPRMQSWEFWEAYLRRGSSQNGMGETER